MASITTKRIYEPAEKTDGFRILVDRLWPRGVSKEKAKIDLWLKEIAPSTELRQWYQHDPDKWDEFKKRYYHELDAQPDVVNQLAEQVKKHHVTLVYSSKNEDIN